MKKSEAAELLAEFCALNVSYSVAAAETKIPAASIHGLLHGRTDRKSDQRLETLRQWMDERRKRRAGYTTRPMSRALANNGVSIESAALRLNMDVVALRDALQTGQWDSIATYRKFETLLGDEKERGGAKVLTKISLGEEVLEHFGLKRDPFTNEMDDDSDIVDTKESAKAERKIKTAIEKNGWCAVTGPVGSGKSTLIKKVKAWIVKRRDILVVEPRTLEKQFLGASHVCDALIEDLGGHVSAGQRTLEYKARMVARILEQSSRDGKKVVVLIDEAHLLRDEALLALKRIYEFELGFKKLLALVLVGQHTLARRLKNNFALAEVGQRVDLYELGSLNGATGSYLKHKLERAGAREADIFDASALKAIARKADTPLSVNNLAAMALITAVDMGEKKISGEIVDAVQAI